MAWGLSPFLAYEPYSWLVVLNTFFFHPYLGKWSNFTNIFSDGLNHQLDSHHQDCCIFRMRGSRGKPWFAARFITLQDGLIDVCKVTTWCQNRLQEFRGISIWEFVIICIDYNEHGLKNQSDHLVRPDQVLVAAGNSLSWCHRIHFLQRTAVRDDDCWKSSKRIHMLCKCWKMMNFTSKEWKEADFTDSMLCQVNYITSGDVRVALN